VPGKTEAIVVSVSALKQNEVVPVKAEIVPVGAVFWKGTDCCKLEEIYISHY